MRSVVGKVVCKVQGDLNSQYLAYRGLMWADLLLATSFAYCGSAFFAFAFAIIGLLLGALSNDKLNLLNQQVFLQNQMRIEHKLNILLEGK